MLPPVGQDSEEIRLPAGDLAGMCEISFRSDKLITNEPILICKITS
jgi:hypothetical protein